MIGFCIHEDLQKRKCFGTVAYTIPEALPRVLPFCYKFKYAEVLLFADSIPIGAIFEADGPMVATAFRNGHTIRPEARL